MKNKWLIILLCLLIILLAAVIPHLPKGDAVNTSVSSNDVVETEQETEHSETEITVRDFSEVKMDVYDLEKQIYYCDYDKFYEESLSDFVVNCKAAFGCNLSVSNEDITLIYNSIVDLCKDEDTIYLVGKPTEEGIVIHICDYKDFTSYRESFELGSD